MKEMMRSKKAAIVDMTAGSPTALILGFAIPMLLGTLFQQFYSMADTVIVGRYLSINALAGVGSTAAINFLINGFVIGMSSGFAIPVAQRFGARDYTDMRKFIANTIWLSLIFSFVVTGLVAIFTKPLLVWTQTPEEIMPYAYQYIFIIFLGIPTTYLYNVTASLIRALGDSKTPVYFLILASVINIVLDFVTIVGFGFSVNGPALATVFSQAVSGILCIFYMRKKFPLLRFAPRELNFDRRKCEILLAMALPMGLQYSITAIGSVIVQSAVNMLGTVTVAAVTAGQKISMFLALSTMRWVRPWPPMRVRMSARASCVVSRKAFMWRRESEFSTGFLPSCSASSLVTSCRSSSSQRSRRKFCDRQSSSCLQTQPSMAPLRWSMCGALRFRAWAIPSLQSWRALRRWQRALSWALSAFASSVSTQSSLRHRSPGLPRIAS